MLKTGLLNGYKHKPEYALQQSLDGISFNIISDLKIAKLPVPGKPNSYCII